MIIENINDFNKKLVDSFIKRIPTIMEIEKDILENMIIIRNDLSVLVMISYENYMDKGLIRYFVFQKDVSFEDLELLFNEMKKKAEKDEMKYLITVIEDEELMVFFEKLGFKKIDTKRLYLYETALIDTVYSKAICMIYEMKEGLAC